MRFWQRSLLICLGAVAVLALVPIALQRLGASVGVAMAIGAILTFISSNGLLYLALRCASCGRWACRTPGGYTTVWPGMRCRYCQRAY